MRLPLPSIEATASTSIGSLSARSSRTGSHSKGPSGEREEEGEGESLGPYRLPPEVARVRRVEEWERRASTDWARDLPEARESIEGARRAEELGYLEMEAASLRFLAQVSMVARR